MGQSLPIANPDAMKCAYSIRLPAEQRIGGGAVLGRLVPVNLHPFDFGFEQGDPFAQFVLRIGREVFGCELARGIAPGAWKIAFVHCRAVSQAGRLAVNR